MILIVLKVQVRPDRRDVWLERSAKYTAAVRQEPGNISYDCYQSVESPNEFCIVEAFADKAAGETHVQTEHFKDLLVWFPTVIGAKPRIIHTEVPADFAPMNEFG